MNKNLKCTTWLGHYQLTQITSGIFSIEQDKLGGFNSVGWRNEESERSYEGRPKGN
ncbi:MAG: hypothetical protein KatS3mg079_826 [Caloramator sp.]|nr:MAG: hypothetical protein KatS3mg079_826 [Caloramator sp.]